MVNSTLSREINAVQTNDLSFQMRLLLRKESKQVISIQVVFFRKTSRETWDVSVHISVCVHCIQHFYKMETFVCYFLFFLAQ